MYKATPEKPEGLLTGEEWYARFLAECEWFECEEDDAWGEEYRRAARKAAGIDDK